MKEFFEFKLRNAPLPVKALIAGYLMCLAAGYVYALVNVVLVVGLKHDQIAIHYYGAKEKLAPLSSENTKEQSLDLDKPGTESAPMISQPSLKKLVAEGHFHLFGMTSFFFGLTIFGLFTHVGARLKTFLVATPYLGILIDNFSFVATRFLGPPFAYLTAAAGSMMALSFALLWLVVFFEIIHNAEDNV